MKTSPASNIRIISRPFRADVDFMRVHRFLSDTYELNRTYHNWEIRRWEGQWYWGDDQSSAKWARHVHIWETASGDLAGVAHSEGSDLGNAWLQIHPDFRHLEEEMLCWAEANLAVPNESGKKQLDWDTFEYDSLRQELLARHGYEQQPGYGVLRWRSLDESIPDDACPHGYLVRAMRPGDLNDVARFSEVIEAVFPHADPSPETVQRFQTSPSYRDELNLVAEAPDGSFASFAGLTIDEPNRTAIFEPVGTHPGHLRRGLARAVMCEGMRRLQSLDVRVVYVGTGDMIPANGLYVALGFHDCYKTHNWRKVF